MGNPGICCIYIVRGYEHRKKPKGIIFHAGRATRVDWYTQGRPATRSEVVAAFDASLPTIGAAGKRQAIEKRVADLLPG